MLKDFSENGIYFIKDEVVINRSLDKFNHEDIAYNLKNIIDLNDAPFSVAITGEWGLGKSSVLEILKEICSNSSHANNYKFCDINAWKYEKEAIRKSFLKNIFLELNGKKPSRWNELIDAIRNTTQIDEDKTQTTCEKLKDVFMSSFKILFQIVGYACVLWVLIFLFRLPIKEYNDHGNFWIEILFPILAGIGISIIQLFNNVLKNKTFVRVIPPIESTDEYEALFLERKKELMVENEKLKIIVIVDDLDRLCPQKMVEALDAIKAFQGCIFIVPFDEQILKNALEDKKVNLSNNEYLTITGELFLEKMFQFKIPLNPMIELDIRKHAENIITEQTCDLYNFIGKENLNDVLDILVHTGVSNPRKLKKIINLFANNLLLVKRREFGKRLNKGLLSDNEGIKLVAKLSVLQSDFSQFYKILSQKYDYIDDFLEIANHVATFNNIEENEADFEELRFTESSQFFVFKYRQSELVDIKLKTEYLSLYHFLNATNDITLDKISSFIFMAQSSDAYAVGDKTTREIIEAIISNSIIPIKNAFAVSQENMVKIESLILNSLTSNTVKYRIENTIYCLINSLSMDNSIPYFNAVGDQITKLLAIKKLNPMRFDLDCLFLAFKKSSSDVYNLLIDDITQHLINEDIKNLSPDGKEMDLDTMKMYIIKLYKLLISIESKLTEKIRKQCMVLSGSIMEDNNKYVTSKYFLDEIIIDNGSNCVLVDKNILMNALIKTIIKVENNSKTYFAILKDLLKHFSQNDGEEVVSQSLYELIKSEVIDKDILSEVLKYSACFTEDDSNLIIEELHEQKIFEDDSYSNIIVEVVSVLQWSHYATEFVDAMFTYMQTKFAVDLSKGLLAVTDNKTINEMTSFNTILLANLLTYKQYYNLLSSIYLVFNTANKTSFYNCFCPYIQSVQTISVDISSAVQEICRSVIEVDEARQKIMDTLALTLGTWQQSYANSSYKEWVSMNLHIVEICSPYDITELIERFITDITSFTVLSTEVVDSSILSFNNVFDDASDVSKIKMANFVVQNINYVTDISRGIAVVKYVITEDTLKEIFDIKTNEFIEFIKKVSDKDLQSILKLVVDYNIPVPATTIGLLLDKLLLDSNYNEENCKLLSLLYRRECDNLGVGISLIEDILKLANGNKLDSFVLRIFDKAETRYYELFKGILYSQNNRTTRQVYNILNLAKAFEKLFTKKIKGDLLCC